MFRELVPILRQRAVLLTLTSLDEDQIRVNVVPKKLADGDNDALTTPLSVTGTAEELDAELSATIVSFVASHLTLKNTLERAKAEMAEAAKAAQAEARAKSKVPARKELPKPESAKSSVAAVSPEPSNPDQPKTASLFDTPIADRGSAPAAAIPFSPVDPGEEDEILAEIEEDEQSEEGGGLDEAA